MQVDKYAFEGWIVCLKRWFPEIDKVEINWKHIKENNLHYNRFLFRVLQFKQMYSWFSFSEEKNQAIADFKKGLEGTLLMNYPEKDKVHKIKGDEDKIEMLFANKYEALLKERLQLNFLNQQLPVGVFEEFEEEKKKRRLFTGGKSAIDLWGIKNNELCIFELKYHNKKPGKVGIISELLFYLSLMNEVFITEGITYPKIDDKDDKVWFRGFDKLYGKKFTSIKGYFLIDKLHPLIDQKVVDMINLGLKEIGSISVHILKYKYDTELDKIELL